LNFKPPQANRKAEAVRPLLENLDLEALSAELPHQEMIEKGPKAETSDF
jgi:hypothetical protein